MRCDHVRPHLRRAGLGVQCARVARWRLVGLRDDVWAVLTRHAIAADGTPGRDRGQTSAAAELGVGRASVHRWVRGGWLLATRGRETGGVIDVAKRLVS